MKNLFILGCGEMGGAILESILKEKVFLPQNIKIVSRRKDKENFLGCKVVKEATFQEKDILLLATPPQEASNVLKDLNLNSSHLLISIMAGYSTQSIQKFHPTIPIIRCMPNLLIKIQKGITAYFLPPSLSKEHQEIFQKMFSSFGELIQVHSEKELDCCTALLGSGVGFAFYIFESFLKAAKKLNFSHEIAKKIVLDVFKNSAFFANNSVFELDQLVKTVSTKKGTTEAGISILKKKKVDKVIEECILNSYNRSQELFQG